MSESTDRETNDGEFNYELRAFILKAMDKCYVTGEIEKTTIPELPGSNVYRYGEENFSYVDIYFVNGEQSGGTTTVFLNDEPVWIFHYSGYCVDSDPETIAFLKAALHESYAAGSWVAARGATIFKDTRWPDLVYFNDTNNIQGLTFTGEETIRTLSSKKIDSKWRNKVFYHRFQARLLTE